MDWSHVMPRRVLARIGIGAIVVVASLMLIVPIAGLVRTAGAAVTCPSSGAANDGCGAMTVSPTSAQAAASLATVTFTFDSRNNTFPSNSLVTLAVPSGWTKPQTTTSNGAGYISVGPPSPSSGLTACQVPATNTDVVGISAGPPWVITINLKCQSPHSGFQLTYSSVTASTNLGTTLNTFTTQTKAGNGAGHQLVGITSSPAINIVDTIKPTLSVTHTVSGLNGWNTNSPVTLAVTAGDTGSGLAGAPTCTDGTTSLSLTGSNGSWATSVSDDGTHTVSCSVNDKAGNTQTAGDTVKIDTTPPTLSVSHTADGNNGYNLSSPVSVSITAGDATSGLAGSPTCTDASNPLTLTGSNGSWTASVSGAGTHSISCSVGDTAGNSQTASDTVKIDAPPATPAFSQGENGGYTRGGTSTDPLTITGTGTPGSTVTLYVDATACTGTGSGTATVDSNNNWSIPLTSISEGSHTFRAIATDPAGNRSGCSSPITGTVDRTAPTSSVTFPAVNTSSPVYLSAGAWNAGCSPVGLCGTVSDSGAGVAGVYVAIQQNSSGLLWDGHAFSSTGGWLLANLGTAVSGTTPWSLPVSLPPDGTYTVASGAVDNAGNVEQTLYTSVCGTSTTLDNCYTAGGLSQLNTGLSQLNTGLSQINTGLSQLNTGLSQINTGLSQLNTGAGGADLGNVVVDTTPPTASVVVDGQTQDGSVNINPAATAPVRITFNEPMAQSSITNISLSPAAGTPACGTPGAPDPLCENVSIGSLSPATVYTLTVSGATDLAGNLVVPLTFHFTTAQAAPVDPTDTDSDGIPDAWDGTTTPTFTWNGQSTNTLAWNFSPTTQDLCLVENYMTGKAADGNTYNQEISQTANQMVVDALARHNIHLVIFEGDGSGGSGNSAGLPAGYNGPWYGGPIAMTDPLGNVNNGSFDWTAGSPSFDQIRNTNFVPTGLAQFCHYAVIAHDMGGTTSTGSSRGLNGSDIVISLAIGDNGVGSIMQQAGTLMHELGHNLGLEHGGGDSVNYKPNYLSVMNYSYQFTGVLRSTPSAGSQACQVGGVNLYCLLDYSETALPSLTKSNLSEGTGLNPNSDATVAGALAGYAMKHKCGSTSTVVANAAGPIDWNCNGATDSSAVSYDINYDGSSSDTLNGYNDWAHLNFLVGTIGLGENNPNEESQGPPPTTSTIDVVNATPDPEAKLLAPITWGSQGGTTPNFTYGTPLPASLFNATSSVPGTFTYSPAVGTILDAGPQTLTATFTPTDTTNYAVTTATLPITVTPAPATLTLGNLSQTYSGSPEGVTVTTNPSALTGVSVTYTGTNGTTYPTSTTPPTNAGSYSVVASLTNTDYAANNATDTLVIAKKNQTITFVPLQNPYYVAQKTISLTATSDSGLPVSFGVGTGQQQCTVSGSTATIVGAGTCVITASQNGNGNYKPATSVSQTATIGLAQGVAYVLDPTASQALNEGGKGCLLAAGNVYVNSSASNAIYQGGQGCSGINSTVNGHAFNATGGGTINVVGGYSAGCCTPTPVSKMTSPVADPLGGGALAVPTYSGGSWYAAGSTTALTTRTVSSSTLQPGVYVGGIKLSGGSYTMQPGVYVMDGGGFSISSSTVLSGSGVFIYNSNHSTPSSCGAISISGSGSINVSAASSGAYAQTLLAQDSACSTAATLSGGSNLVIGGAAYLPSASLTLSGQSTSSVPVNWQAILIARTMSVSGQGAISLTHP